jgi:DNA-binding NarL/FixJ family response regulator
MSSVQCPIRVLVADDHERIRCALGQLLGTVEDIEVVGLAVDGAEAVAMAASLAPDVILMDVSMPALDGIEATRRIVEQNPGLGVVTLTAFRSHRDEARHAGAAAHLLKDAAPEELIRCIRDVAATLPVRAELRPTGPLPT